jgi:hypothetical protein
MALVHRLFIGILQHFEYKASYLLYSLEGFAVGVTC